VFLFSLKLGLYYYALMETCGTIPGPLAMELQVYKGLMWMSAVVISRKSLPCEDMNCILNRYTFKLIYLVIFGSTGV
jgi:hypothetical protein